MEKKSILLFLLASVIFSSELYSQTADALPFLRMSIGARALGRGGAFTAVSDDVTAIYSNPAGLTLLEGLEFSSMYSALSLDRALNMLSVGFPFDFGSIGLGIVNSGVSGISEYDDSGAFKGDFAYQANAVTLSYAGRIRRGTSVGLNLKTIFDTLNNNSRVGFGMDVGALIRARRDISVGLKVQDLFNTIGGDSAPLIVTLGGAFKALDGLTISADAVHNFERRDIKLKFGAEYTLIDALSVSVGLNDTEASFGLGFSISYLRLWYAFEADKLKSANGHHVSLGAKF